MCGDRMIGRCPLSLPGRAGCVASHAEASPPPPPQRGPACREAAYTSPKKLVARHEPGAGAGQQDSSGTHELHREPVQFEILLREPVSTSARERISLGGSSTTTSNWRPLRSMLRMNGNTSARTNLMRSWLITPVSCASQPKRLLVQIHANHVRGLAQSLGLDRKPARVAAQIQYGSSRASYLPVAFDSRAGCRRTPSLCPCSKCTRNRVPYSWITTLDGISLDARGSASKTPPARAHEDPPGSTCVACRTTGSSRSRTPRHR